MATRTPMSARGYTLLELVLALALGAIVTATVFSIFVTAQAGLVTLGKQVATRSSVHQVLSLIGNAVASSGYHPEPWAQDRCCAMAITDDPAGSQILTVRDWSGFNCYDSRIEGAAGHYLRIRQFSLDHQGSLSMDCLHGPDGGSMVRQVANQALLSGLARFTATPLSGDSPDQLQGARLLFEFSPPETGTAGLNSEPLRATVRAAGFNP